MKIHKMKTLKTLFITLIVGVFVMGASVVFAEEQTYIPLVKLPGFGAAEQPLSIGDFINTTYRIIVVLGAIVGVIKIAIAGVKYSMSDVITDKSEAKKDILGVLLGLAILLLPFVVLNTIYPGLLNLDFTDKLQENSVNTRGVITKKIPLLQLKCSEVRTGLNISKTKEWCSIACKAQAKSEAKKKGVAEEQIKIEFGDPVGEDCPPPGVDGAFTDDCEIMCTAYYEKTLVSDKDDDRIEVGDWCWSDTWTKLPDHCFKTKGDCEDNATAINGPPPPDAKSKWWCWMMTADRL
jgi:hypothetical protein